VKRRAKILFGLVLVVIAGAALLIYSQGRSRRKLEAYEQQLRTQGEKLELGELFPIAPEGSYAAAQSFMSLVNVTGRLSNAPPAMKIIAPGRASVSWRQEAMPDWNNRMTNIWPGLSVELEANRGALSNLESLLNGPALCFNLDYSKGFALLLPHLAPLRQAEVLASAAAMSALHQYDYAQAWKHLQTTVGLVQRYEPEPIVISHLVRVGMANIAIDATWQFLQSDRWTDGQLAELQADWESLEFFDASATAFAMERATDIGTFELLRKAYNEMTNMLGSGSGSGGLLNDPVELAKDVAERWHYRIWQHSWSYDEESYFIEMSTAGLRAIRSTELTGTYFPVLKGLRAEITRINRIHTNDIGHFLLRPMLWRDEDWISASVVNFANAEVARRLAVTAIALKRYKLRHGKYPADLNVLVPEFCKQVPVDFMDGRPMRYKPTPDGNYLLYSVGEDGEDNGGDSTQIEGERSQPKSFWTGGRSWLKGRDIVWPQPATAEQVAEYYKESSPKFFPIPGPVKATPVSTNAPAGTNAAGR
jgi:hypothetical protein